MIIRRLTENDVEDYKELRLRSLKEDPDSFLRTYEEEYKKPLDFYINRFKNEWTTDDQFILGVFLDEKLSGHVGLRREKNEKIKHKGILWGMYVVSEQRGKGIGKILIRELINRAKKIEGLEQISLIVVHTNEAAKKLYHQFGFHLYATEKRAIKVNDRYLDEDYMTLYMND